MTTDQLQDELTAIMYGADWKDTLLVAFKPDVEAAMEAVERYATGVVIAELERINKANIDNGINFYFEDMKDKSDGWLTMRQYIPERIAALQKNV